MAVISPSVKPIDSPFIQEKSPADNLERLSSPKLLLMPATCCITREVNQKISRFANTSLLTLVTYGITFLGLASLGKSFYHRAIGCMAFRNWQNNFFSHSSECLGQTVTKMISKGERAALFSKILITSIGALGSYTTWKFLSNASHQKTRVAMLSREYSDMADFFEASSKSKDEETLKKLKATAAGLKANLPIIQARLKIAGHIEAGEAALITHRLSRIVNRLLGKAP